MPRTLTLRAGTAGIASFSLFALAACGGGDEEASAWILTGGGWPAIEEDLERFNEDREAEIDVEALENDAYKQQIRTAVGSGDAPTMIMSWTGGALLEYVEQDRIIPLDGNTGELDDRVYESVWQNGVVDDSVYAVPLNDVQPVVMYYNQEVLDEHDLSLPETWSDVEDIIDALGDVEDVDAFSLAGGSVWPAFMWLAYLTDRHGGEEVFQAVVEGEEGAWDHESIIWALETMQDLGDAGFIRDYNAVDAGQNEDAQLLADGRAAFLLQGSWVYATINQDFPEFADSGNFGFTEFPVLEEGAGDPSNIVGNPANFWSVSADATEQEQEVAFDYISEHLYNDQAVDEMLEAGSLPPLNDIGDRIEGSEAEEFLSFADELVGSANHFQLSWDQAISPSEEQAFGDNVAAILQGNMTPQEFVDSMNSQ
ncbi:ABC transporter substrate-binding protein [Nesterenkonia sphaerica]|uniref:Extracellular solute-binding protein n=1 Tax=Nesterenkonia sphaerica TaxID=1804988 RepID=A0A5R9A278_9MICC|nr:extracellular solute-binding protein [Nesterenkonia sphaerica]TLP72811.1 extracellular solute-binding protein [Nesterenkonia sphaerica]